MRPIHSIALFPAALAFASCASAQTGDSAPAAAGAIVAGDPVTLPQAAPFDVASHGAFREPWAIAVEPGTGNLFITEKAGTARIYDPATGRTMDVAQGLPEVSYGGQGGLHDIAFAPDYADTGAIYLSWAADAGGDLRKGVLGRGILSCDDAAACRVDGLTQIWEQNLASDRGGHFALRIAFAPDGQHLFLASGDRQMGNPAQDNSNNVGTIVRLNMDGSAASGNPLAGQAGASPDLWAWGIRNPLGFGFDLDGNLWDVEHGPRGGDEMNLILPGRNYGWPDRSYGINYNGDHIEDHSADDGFTKPALHWTPVIAPGGMIFYDGDAFAAWRGQALVANLGSQSLVRISVSVAGDDGVATEAERYRFPRRLRDIAQGHDGSLWLIEDGGNGRLLRVMPQG